MRLLLLLELNFLKMSFSAKDIAIGHVCCCFSVAFRLIAQENMQSNPKLGPEMCMVNIPLWFLCYSVGTDLIASVFTLFFFFLTLLASAVFVLHLSTLSQLFTESETSKISSNAEMQ